MVERLAGKTAKGIDGAGGQEYGAAAPVGATGVSITVCSMTAYKLKEHLGRLCVSDLEVLGAGSAIGLHLYIAAPRNNHP